MASRYGGSLVWANSNLPAPQVDDVVRYLGTPHFDTFRVTRVNEDGSVALEPTDPTFKPDRLVAHKSQPGLLTLVERR
jgi:hypothetical protein